MLTITGTEGFLGVDLTRTVIQGSEPQAAPRVLPYSVTQSDARGVDHSAVKLLQHPPVYQ